MAETSQVNSLSKGEPQFAKQTKKVQQSCWRWIELQSVSAVLPAFVKSGLPSPADIVGGWVGTSACAQKRTPLPQ